MVDQAEGFHGSTSPRNSSTEEDDPLGQNLGKIHQTGFDGVKNLIDGRASGRPGMMFDVVGAGTNKGHIEETANIADPEDVVDQIAKLKRKKNRTSTVIINRNQPRTQDEPYASYFYSFFLKISITSSRCKLQPKAKQKFYSSPHPRN